MVICITRFKMDSTEEPQKKVFKARKTMKASDRQQLEAVHKAKEELIKPSDLKLLNGNHDNGDLDLNSSHNDLDAMADKRELNGMLNICTDPYEIPIVKLSDIKDDLRNSDQARDFKLKVQTSSDSLASKEIESNAGFVTSELNNQACIDKDEEQQCVEKNTVLERVDKKDPEDFPVEEDNLPCENEDLEESKSNISEEEESHIVLEGIHELEEENPEEDRKETEQQENIDLMPDKQDDKTENEMMEDNMKNSLDSLAEDFNVKEQGLTEESQKDLENEALHNRTVADGVSKEEMTEKPVTELVEDSKQVEETQEMVVAEESDSLKENCLIPDTMSVDQHADEEAISSSMEIDQNVRSEEQKSTSVTETIQEKMLSELQTTTGLESLDTMETDEIIPILEKLAPVEDELQCFSTTDLNSKSDVNIDDEKVEISPSKQESSETLPSEAFLFLSDEDESCDIPTVEEKASITQEPSTDNSEKPTEKEEEQKDEPNTEELHVEKTEVSRRKRSKSEDLDSQSSKRRRFEGEEYEAELQVKITAADDLNKKLHMVIQKMLDEKLTALQCIAFDKTMADLKTRVEKIECKKHENVLHAIQAKIARLTKRFGAAKEDLKKRPEQIAANQPASPEKPANDLTLNSNTLTYRNASTVRQMLESKRNVGETSPSSLQSSTTGQQSVSSPSSLPLRSPIPAQVSVNQSTANTALQGRTPPDWKLIQQKINASSIGTSQNPLTSQSKSSPPVTSAPVMTSVLPAPSTATVVGNTQVSTSSTQPMSVSLQSLPVILHVPVAMPSQSQILQGTTGTLVTNQQSGNVEFIPVQNQSSVNSLTKTPPVSLTAPKPMNSPSMPSPGIQRNSPASSIASTLAVQAISTTHSVAQLSRQPLAPAGTSGVYSQANSRTSSQLKSPVSSFTSPSSAESSSASRQELQTNRTPIAETSLSKRAVESNTPSAKAGGGVIDLTLDDEELEATSQESRRPSTASVSGGLQLSQGTGRPSQPIQAPQPNTLQAPSVPAGLPSQATIHVLPTAQTTVNITQRPGTQAPTRALVPRPPNNQQMVYTTTTLPTVPAQTAVRSTLMQNQNLRQISPQTGGVPVRMPQTTAYVVNNGMSVGSAGPQLTVHHRPPQEPVRPIHPAPLPEAPQPQRLPPEAAATSAPQKPHLKLARVQSQNGIVLSWSVLEVDRTCAIVDSYHLYAYHEDPSATSSSQWKKIGEVKALPLPMACTLTQFVSGSKYYFAVRAKDIYGRFGPFCEPQSTDVISTQSS
ncbi:activating transcription factor 7-interacting protein 1 [Pelodytes ibericus]